MTTVKCIRCSKTNETEDIFGCRTNGVQYKTCITCRSKRRKIKPEILEDEAADLRIHTCSSCKKTTKSIDANIFGFKKNGIEYKTCVPCRSRRKKRRTSSIEGDQRSSDSSDHMVDDQQLDSSANNDFTAEISNEDFFYDSLRPSRGLVPRR